MSRLMYWLANFCVYTAGASFVKKFIMFPIVPKKKFNEAETYLHMAYTIRTEANWMLCSNRTYMNKGIRESAKGRENLMFKRQQQQWMDWTTTITELIVKRAALWYAETNHKRKNGKETSKNRAMNNTKSIVRTKQNELTTEKTKKKFNINRSKNIIIMLQ